MEWRSHEEEQEKLQEDHSAIQLKQQRHLEEYQRQREELAHLSWRQRKAALYRANKTRFSIRPSEHADSDELRLPLVIKGVCSPHSPSPTRPQLTLSDPQETWTARWRRF